jgi:hypothetical protein
VEISEESKWKKTNINHSCINDTSESERGQHFTFFSDRYGALRENKRSPLSHSSIGVFCENPRRNVLQPINLVMNPKL